MPGTLSASAAILRQVLIKYLSGYQTGITRTEPVSKSISPSPRGRRRGEGEIQHKISDEYFFFTLHPHPVPLPSREREFNFEIGSNNIKSSSPVSDFSSRIAWLCKFVFIPD
jgi:hypothetical protein